MSDSALAGGTVQMGSLPVHVQTYYESVAASYYLVTPARGHKGSGEVRVNAASRFSCTTCRKLDCLHVDAARKFVASQPLEPTGTAGDHVGPRI